MKAILNNREKVSSIQGKWEDMMMKERFCMTDIYMELRRNDGEVMPWRKLMYCNAARPRAVMTLWLTCHQKLAMQTRLVRYGMVANNTCCFCDAEETIAHLFFGCATMRKVWKDILVWIGFHHESDTWDREIIWLLRYGSGKGWKAALLSMMSEEVETNVENEEDVGVKVDFSDAFNTFELFGSRDEVLQWARSLTHDIGFVAIIMRSDTNTGVRGRASFLLIAYERSGEYMPKKHNLVRACTDSRKCGCLFKLRAKPVSGGDD
ncbi:hypothetical protein HKD37_09G025695 [Glycine soja]